MDRDHIREAICGSKVKHDSREAAMITAKKMKDTRLVAYKCPYCSTKKKGVWHLGHK